MTPGKDRTALYSGDQRREAAEWFVVIHAEDDPSTETLQGWLRWMEIDEGNRAAFEAVVQAWHSTPAYPALAMPDEEELVVDQYTGEQSVAEWIREQPEPASATESLRGARRRGSFYRTRRSWLLAASIAALSVGVLVFYRDPAAHSMQSSEFATKAREQIEITMADGSRAWLGPRSVLRVAFTKDSRNVELATGEAFFSVKKDHSRPFVVHSAGGDITAVGTAFNVRAVNARVTVAVSEGVVAVAPTPAPKAGPPGQVRVASGQEATFAAREPIGAIEINQSPMTGERSRWREGILVYRNEALRDVILDVARYSGKQLEIAGESIGDMRYSGVVFTNALDEWMSALPESFPVRIVSDGEREILEPR